MTDNDSHTEPGTIAFLWSALQNAQEALAAAGNARQVTLSTDTLQTLVFAVSTALEPYADALNAGIE